jgi:hypothetical protein
MLAAAAPARERAQTRPTAHCRRQSPCPTGPSARPIRTAAGDHNSQTGRPIELRCCG